jgi:hypothetical protein
MASAQHVERNCRSLDIQRAFFFSCACVIIITALRRWKMIIRYSRGFFESFTIAPTKIVIMVLLINGEFTIHSIVIIDFLRSILISVKKITILW